jgi:hypothetical protein
MPHAKAISPLFDGVNSMATCSFKGGDELWD